MHGTLRSSRAEPTEIDRPNCPESDHLVAPVLNEIVLALWPSNTAASLAACIVGPDGKPPAVRTVERYMQGKREWSGDAIAAIVAEILSRHKMRNIKITKR